MNETFGHHRMNAVCQFIMIRFHTNTEWQHTVNHYRWPPRSNLIPDLWLKADLLLKIEWWEVMTTKWSGWVMKWGACAITCHVAVCRLLLHHTQAPILPSVDDWRLTENFRMDNPIIQERDGSRKFYLEFDVSQFKPEEINVKTSGSQLSVHARHDDKDPSRTAYREFARQYTLPKEVKPEFLMSKLSERGKLTIEAPLPALPGSRDKLIPIEHRK